jgi:hypothetical protein
MTDDADSPPAAVENAEQEMIFHLRRQLLNSLWLPSAMPQKDRDATIVAAMELLGRIEHRGAMEGMLAVQMIATHHAAMDCLRRAMLENQPMEARDRNLKNAAKLLGIYERQVAALDKRHGRGQQSVTVKYVHVAEGAQAIVGNVSHAAPKHAPRTGDPRTIEAPNEQPMEILTPTEPKSRAAVASGGADTEVAPPARSRRRRTK